MLERFRSLAEGVLFLAMAALALTAIGAFVWIMWPSGWRGEGAASWVQAIGSVVGLAIAIYVPWRQRRNSELAAATEAAEQRKIVSFETASVAIDVKSFLRTLEKAVSVQLPGREFVVDETEFADLLQRITWCRQRTSSSAHALLELRHTLTQATEILRRHAYPALHMPDYEKAWVVEYAEKASTILDDILGD